ncbi:uncharacterized protein LOC116305540 [Actinia tenebrosa]|uniref:Uncharacterized protein LOC116305540 n=1 Tax=Actinia tenebrosa TaxID=6105 RepID=A0A6P8IZH6_ACTTE|nr:uncharacterized protein LOC116305540 [Actinia tenebrosa]
MLARNCVLQVENTLKKYFLSQFYPKLCSSSYPRVFTQKMASSFSGPTVWSQTVVSIESKKRGIHLITDEITSIPELRKYKVGLVNLCIQHTSASLSLNESWDPSVRVDMEMMLNRLAPENAPYTHTMEESDDMPAHVKTSLMGASLTIPITSGRLNLGTWQGIWLCEHRDRGSSRKIVVTMQGVQ